MSDRTLADRVPDRHCSRCFYLRSLVSSRTILQRKDCDLHFTDEEHSDWKA